MEKKHKVKKDINTEKTTWGNVAFWYDGLLEKGVDTYQKELILPNLSKIMDLKSGESVLDLACGQGFFLREFVKKGVKAVGVDISKELIEIAIKNSSQDIKYIISSSHNIPSVPDESFDKITIILALQNIEKIFETIKECKRILKTNGKLYIVLNHPAFRVPKKSDWGFDVKKGIQYRRIEQYVSEQMIKIDMNPGEKDIKKKEYTFSFHRPLQNYFKIFNTFGLKVSNLEEWCSHKSSQDGPRKKAEDKARGEIPIFMCIEIIK